MVVKLYTLQETIDGYSEGLKANPQALLEIKDCFSQVSEFELTSLQAARRSIKSQASYFAMVIYPAPPSADVPPAEALFSLKLTFKLARGKR